MRVATELGDALIAYWRNGGWFGCDTFIRWLINHGHVAEAAYALQAIAAVQRDEEAAKNVRERMRGPENKLAERLRETLPTQLPDSRPGVVQEPLPGPAQAS
ncbi:hypothetical protein ABZ897_60010 [Nonomuraea sp. NPDC046802]|uniref:hypothetical protein n=1 Tax=Nonomuraea sp. NPDC046802 TaxID=3154919 RepID=UPI0033C5753D